MAGATVYGRRYQELEVQWHVLRGALWAVVLTFWGQIHNSVDSLTNVRSKDY